MIFRGINAATRGAVGSILDRATFTDKFLEEITAGMAHLGSGKSDIARDTVLKNLTSFAASKIEDEAVEKIQCMIDHSLAEKVVNMDFSGVERRMMTVVYKRIEECTSNGLAATLTHVNELQRKVLELETPSLKSGVEGRTPVRTITYEDYEALEKKMAEREKAHQAYKQITYGIMYGCNPNMRTTEERQLKNRLEAAGHAIKSLQESLSDANELKCKLRGTVNDMTNRLFVLENEKNKWVGKYADMEGSKKVDLVRMARDLENRLRRHGHTV